MSGSGSSRNWACRDSRTVTRSSISFCVARGLYASNRARAYSSVCASPGTICPVYCRIRRVCASSSIRRRYLSGWISFRASWYSSTKMPSVPNWASSNAGSSGGGMDSAVSTLAK